MSINQGDREISTIGKNASDARRKVELLKMSQAVNLLGSWEWDLKTNRLFWTDEMFILRATPVSADSVISFEENIQFIHEDDRELVKEKFASLSQKQDVSFEYRIISRDGKTKTVSAWASMFRDEQGEPMFIRGTSQDITAQREAENKLKELHLALEYAEEISDLGNWQFKVRSNEFLISANLYRLLGCEFGTIESTFERLLDFVHPEDQEKMKTVLSESFHGHMVQPVEYRIIRNDGEVRFMRSRSKLLTNIFGETVVLGTMQDITKEVCYRRKLEEKNSFLELLFENSVDHIAAYDVDGLVTAWNKRNEQRYGLKKEDALGKHISEVFTGLTPEQFEDMNRALQGEQISSTGQIIHGADELFEYFLIPLKDKGGAVFGVLYISHDLSSLISATDKLNELNESLEIKNRELERINDEMASFSYVASHDLQEPLRKIQTFTRLIADKDFNVLSEKGKDYFQRVESAASRMQILIDDLLTFSRTNTLPKDFTETDLNQLLENVKREIKDSIEEKSAVIHSSGLPKANVIPFQFKQLLENLLLNSIKYAKEGIPPVIHISSMRVSGKEIPDLPSGREYFMIRVEDNGIGFHEEYCERIFELFQRLHGKHEYPGTGLGLAICRKIVQNHKGKIMAQGIEGEGAAFTIYIPD